MRWGILTALLILAGLTPPAAAQLPAPPDIPILPRPGQPAPPSQPPPAPDPGPGTPPGPADAASYQGNPAHTGQAGEEAVFGPLQGSWIKRFADPGVQQPAVSQPLLIGGRLLLTVVGSSGTQLVALDARNGRELWRRQGTGSKLAADGSTVVALGGGFAQAFAIADGRPRWTASAPPARNGAPVAAAGRFFVWSQGNGEAARGELRAFSLRDGALLWTRAPLLTNANGTPAVAGDKVFVPGDCGSAAAVSQATGAVVWIREPYDTCFGRGAIVAGGRVFVGGRAYLMDTGADAARWPYPPGAVAGGIAVMDGDLTRGVSIAGGGVRWTQRSFAGLLPLVVGPAVYVTQRSGTALWGLDLASGRLLSGYRLPARLVNPARGELPGKVAGAGRLVVAEGSNIIAFESLLKPRPGGLDFGADRWEVTGPGRVGFVGGLHPGLRGRVAAIDLQFDPHPYGRFRRVARGRVASDGTTYFTARVTRNTRVRVAAVRGSGRSPVDTVVAYPRWTVRWRALGRTRVVGSVRLWAGSDFRMGGRQLVLYNGSALRKRYERLGTARLAQVGRGVAVGRVAFVIPRGLSGRDVTAYCIPRMPSLGYGYNDAFQRRCGRRIIPM